jgi:LysM repeat protein
MMALVLCMSAAAAYGAEERTHTVVKGDTLWDISMKYLRTPWKWPLVWANNKDITNPHLIYPGDKVIITTDGKKTMFKIVPSGGGEETAIYTTQEISAVKDKSIMVAPQFSLYMYSPDALKGSGEIIRKFGGGELVSENDRVVIKTSSALEKGRPVTIVTKIKEVVDEEGSVMGHLYRITGMACIDEAEHGMARATVSYSLQESRVGSLIFEDVLPIKPITLNISEPPDVSATVVDQHGGVIGCGQFDLVFMDAGRNRGIDKGSLLSVYRKTTLSDSGDNEISAAFHEPLGLVVVLQSLESSSMGLVVESRDLIEKGSAVTGRSRK